MEVLTLNNLVDLILDAQTEEEIQSLAAQVKEKGAACAAALRSMELMEEAVSLEAARLKSRAEALRRRKESFKGYILHNLQQLDIDKLDCGGYTLSRQKNPPKVEISVESDIPARYIVTVQTTKVDVAGIKAAIKNGEEVTGAKLVQTERIVIK